MITQQRLHELLNYDPATGVFTRKVSLSNRVKAGGVAGTYCKNKKCTYIKISVDGRPYYGHRLAWLYVYGITPKMLDHVDGNGLNNSIHNLRIADKSANAANRTAPANNSTGVKGVSLSKKSGKYHAYININGRRRNLGQFACLTDAANAYKSAAENLFGKFARAS